MTFLVTLFLILFLNGSGPYLVNSRPLSVETTQDNFIDTEYQRSLASDAANYLLVPAAVVIGTEGAILGATGQTFGEGIQSVGEGLKTVGAEMQDAGHGFTNLSRGLKGLSSIIYRWGTGGSMIPILGSNSDETDALKILNVLPAELSGRILRFYYNLDDETDDSNYDQSDSTDTPST